MPQNYVIDATNSVVGTAYTLQSEDTLHIREGGFIEAAESAIIGSTSPTAYNVSVRIDGRLTAQKEAAIFLSGKGNSLTVGTTGVVDLGDGVIATAGMTNFVNHGSIKGTAFSLFQSHSLVMLNTGIIHNLDFGKSIAVAISTTTEGADIVRNAGTIIGDIQLGAGDDFFDGVGGQTQGLIKMGAGNDTAFGGNGSEVFDMGTGNDKLDAAGGVDTVEYGKASSNYTIIQNSDGSVQVIDKEPGGDGSDMLRNVELLKFSDQTIDLRPVPNPQPPLTPLPTNKILTGTKGKDTLVGDAGSDKLYGGYGNDMLTGGTGQDIFVFNTRLGTTKTDRKVNFDTIIDFNVADDTIWLDNAIFKKLGKGSEAAPAKLNKAFFKTGAPKDGNDFLLYDKKSGVVSYDADGNGTRYEAVDVLKVTKNLSLTADDFRII